MILNKLMCLVCSNTFHYHLESLKGSIYIPKKGVPLVQCWKKALKYLKIASDFDWKGLPKELHCRHVPGIGTGTHIIQLCDYHKVNCVVYILKKGVKYNRFELECNYPETLYKKTIYLYTEGTRWAWFKKTRSSGRIKALDRMQCVTCSEWIACKSKKEFIRTHYSSCCKCVCGIAYKEGESHPNTCKKVKKPWLGKQKDGTPATACKRWAPDTKPHYLYHNSHADFETIPAGVKGKMLVDSAGLWDDTNKVYKVWCGKHALRDWLDYVLAHLKGNLWFFYGSKFDAHMIFEYCIQEGIAIDRTKTLLRGNVIYVMGLIGKKGTIIIKDLTKFLVGSLDFNCKSFGIEQEYAKTSFDHEKCKTWQDVERYKVKKDFPVKDSNLHFHSAIFQEPDVIPLY